MHLHGLRTQKMEEGTEFQDVCTFYPKGVLKQTGYSRERGRNGKEESRTLLIVTHNAADIYYTPLAMYLPHYISESQPPYRHILIIVTLICLIRTMESS